MRKRSKSAAEAPAPGRPLLPLDHAFEMALVELLESEDRKSLVVAGRQLLHVLAPGARISVADTATEPAEQGPNTLILPLGTKSRNALKVQLPDNLDEKEFERRIGLVARLLGAKDDQLRSMRHLADSVHRLERAERLQRALYTIAELASSERDMPSVLRAMHHTIGSLMYADNFYIVFAARDGQSVRFPYFVDVADMDPPLPREEYPIELYENSPTWYVIRDAKALMGSPAELAEQVDGPLKGTGPDCVDWLGVPLMQGEEAVGALVVQSYRDDARYHNEDKSLLTYVAQHVRTTLERHQAHIDLSRRVAERTRALEQANRVLKQQVLERQRGERLQAALFRIAELAGSNSSLTSFYRDVHEVISGLLYARNFYVALVSSDHKHLEFPYSVDEFDPQRATRKRGQGLTEHVLRSGKALLADSDTSLRLQRDGQLVPSGTSSVCWLGVPLIIGEETVGVLAVQSYSTEHRYDSRDQDLLTFVSYHIGNALERKRNAESLKEANSELEQRVNSRTQALAEANHHLRQQILKSERIEQRLKYQTMHDSLTGLPNRSMLLRRMGAALEVYTEQRAQKFAVLFLDLDRFKVINDSVGHMVGDDLLFQAGGRIRTCLKGHDVVARLGGDEFGVLLEHVRDTDEACQVADRIIKELNRPFRLGIKELYTTSSIGIAMAAPHYRRAEELLRDADTAMYRAKAEGRQRYALFDEQMRKQATDLQEIENDLRRAMTRSEFEPYFQPIVRLNNAEVIGYEALLRWHHPTRGILSPEQFLHVAEDSGSDEQIDWIMFDLVLDITPELAREGRFVAINLSARHFRSARLEHRLLALLKRHDVEPAQIRIEVTERVLLDNPKQVRSTLLNLRDKGIGVSLDDFGTGYSSLSYLHQFPLNSLKIDRSFVANLKDDGTGSTPVVRAIKTLADTQGMQVIAEGIETRQQASILEKLGCEFGQGFLYAHPRTAADWQAELHST
ncbi:MAG: EAL domain-containing protein [Rhodanobacteraceae bacterium]